MIPSLTSRGGVHLFRYFLSLMRTPILLLFAHVYYACVCKLQLDLNADTKVYAFKFIEIKMHIIHEQTTNSLEADPGF